MDLEKIWTWGAKYVSTTEMSIEEKVVGEAIAAQKASVRCIKDNRYSDFLLEHALPFVEAVRDIRVHPDQSKEAMDLYQQSVLIHYDVLTSLTKTVSPLDCAFLEWQQTPITLDVMYDLDPDFRQAVSEFVDVIEESDDIIGVEAARIHTGFYGIISATDFAALPGSTLNVIAQIIERSSIPKEYKQAIMAAKSWGLNGIYVFGDRYSGVLKSCGNVQRAIEEEKRYLKWIWTEPSKAMLGLMGALGQSSYDRFRYFEMYGKRFTPYIKAAQDAGVHVANIVMLPTHVGDIGHHIGPSYYHICRDDMCMAILEAVSETVYGTLRRALAMGKIKSPFDVTSVATGASASAMAEILAWEGFTPDMVQDMLQKRFNNYKLAHPYDRPMVGELHINDWLDFATRGASINAQPPRGSDGKVMGVPIDLAAIRFNSRLNNPQWYTYPYTAITVRTTALLRFLDQPCLLAPEPPSIAGLVNATALHPDVPMAPVQLCKNCATSRYLPAKCNYCLSPRLNSVL